VTTSALLPAFALFLVSLFASGCVPEKQGLRTEANWAGLVDNTNTSIVVGRIEWLEKGEPKNMEKGLMGFSVTPQLLRLEDGTRIMGEINEVGRFVWQLEPGTYVINRINYRDAWSGNYFFVPKVGFRIERSEAAYYVGTLKADFAIERDLIGGVSGIARFTIEDEFDNAGKIHSEGYRSIEVSKRLMVRDENLPTTIDTKADFQLAIQILNAVLMGM